MDFLKEFHASKHSFSGKNLKGKSNNNTREEKKDEREKNPEDHTKNFSFSWYYRRTKFHDTKQVLFLTID